MNESRYMNESKSRIVSMKQRFYCIVIKQVFYPLESSLKI